MERDAEKSADTAEKPISTHTLTWSVTIIGANPEEIFAISTHTLTWSVTPAFDWDGFISGISTHTLTWSVTTAPF